MRAAPPVSLRAGGGALWRGLRFGLPALAAAVLVAWVCAHLDWPRTGALVGIAAALIGALAAWRGPTVVAHLQWDGRRWSVDGAEGALEVMIDLERWLLLRLRPADGLAVRWVAVAAAEAGAQMPLLRALVHAGPGGGSEPAAGRGGAVPPPGLER